MEPTIAAQLVALNRQFYDEFAADFSRSRSRLQPGIERALDWLAGATALVDVGCGDGRVGRALASRAERWQRYLGIDISTALIGQYSAPPNVVRALDIAFYATDIARRGWAGELLAGDSSRSDFDAVVCLSVLHHIPGRGARETLLNELGRLLTPGAQVVVSVWQFMHLERFRRKIVPWQTVGLTPEQVDAGDVLLTWERGGTGRRYVHQFGVDELAGLLAGCGYHIHETYRSDGETGDLGLYLLANWPGE